MGQIDGVKTFSATRAVDRERLGQEVEAWSRMNQHLEVVDVRTLQSSDKAYHCLSIVVLWKRKPSVQ